MDNYIVKYKEIALRRIFFLFDSLKLARKRRFTGSGLEKLLLGKQFDDEIDKLQIEIEKIITIQLSSGFLGEIQEEGENYYKKKVVLKIRSYIFVLTCTQLLKEKVIMVEDIQITT